MVIAEYGLAHYYSSDPARAKELRAELVEARGQAPEDLILDVQTKIHGDINAWSTVEELIRTHPLFGDEIRAIRYVVSRMRATGTVRPFLEELSIYRAVSKDRQGFSGVPEHERVAIQEELGVEDPSEVQLIEGILNGVVSISAGFDEEK